ncbi:hypothetical protein BaRGS_00020614, partial [Batillaria attramentaria]
SASLPLSLSSGGKLFERGGHGNLAGNSPTSMDEASLVCASSSASAMTCLTSYDNHHHHHPQQNHQRHLQHLSPSSTPGAMSPPCPATAGSPGYGDGPGGSGSPLCGGDDGSVPCSNIRPMVVCLALLGPPSEAKLRGVRLAVF